LEVRRNKADKRREDLMPVIEAIKAAGVTTIRSITDELNARNIPAPRGGQWSATQVFRLCAKTALQHD
jgi:hypothetical protein